MATIKLCLLLILAVTCVRAQDGTDVSEELEAMPGTSFVYLPASSNAVLGAGESQRRTAREWPALDVRFGGSHRAEPDGGWVGGFVGSVMGPCRPDGVDACASILGFRAAPGAREPRM